MLIKGAMNGEAFLAYIEQCLAPTLKHGDIEWLTMCPSTRSLGSRRLSGVLAQASDSCRSILLILTHRVGVPSRQDLPAQAAERTVEGLHRCVLFQL